MSRALTRWQKPSGPTPTIATDSPNALPPQLAFSMRARSKPWVTAMISVSAASSSGSPSGTLNSGVPGSRYMYSAHPPNRCGGIPAWRLFP